VKSSQSTPSTATPYALGFTSLDSERSHEDLQVEGDIPAWLSGSLLRTGPAKFEVGKHAYRHWFDGQAMLHRFAFDKGKVAYANRFVRSKSYCEAARTGRITRSEFMTDPCRTLFGRVMSWFQDSVTDNPNVNVCTLGGNLVSMSETPMPIRFDPQTLATLGHIHFNGPAAGQITTAHPHHDGRRGYSYFVKVGRKCSYVLFADEVASQRVVAELPARRPAYMHSFGMSEHFLVVTEGPLRLNPLRLLSKEPFIHKYRWKPELGTCFTVVDKSDGSVVAEAVGEPCFAFHHVNVHEANGAVLVDLVTYPDADIIEQLRLVRLRSGGPIDAVGKLARFTIPLERRRRRGPSEATKHILADAPIELPRIDYARRAGRPYRFVWATGLSNAGNFMDNITRLELSGNGSGPAGVKVWHAPGCYPGEPVFAARPGGKREDDGVLLSVVLDTGAQRSFLLVLDAATLTELGRASAPHHIPFGFHGNHFGDPYRPDAEPVHS
jgi:carotenoid cleavage dioxygenase-like enzyme